MLVLRHIIIIIIITIIIIIISLLRANKGLQCWF